MIFIVKEYGTVLCRGRGFKKWVNLMSCRAIDNCFTIVSDASYFIDFYDSRIFKFELFRVGRILIL